MRTPPGFGAVTPYVSVADANGFMAFLCAAFGGVEIGRSCRPDGRIANGQVRIGTVTLMISDEMAGYPARPTAFYLYVADADATIDRAIAAGATLESRAEVQPYDDRQGGVIDPYGNIWWIAERLVDGPYF